MRTLSLFAAALMAAGPLAAQQAAPAAKQADPDKAVAGGGALPEGWSWRPDRAGAALANVKFGPMGKGYHVTLGPSVILWSRAGGQVFPARRTDGAAGALIQIMGIRRLG